MMKKKKENSKNRDLIIKNIRNNQNTSQIKSDNQLLYSSDASSLYEHNQQYSKLLCAYVFNFEKIIKNKRINREKVFQISKGLLIGIPVATFTFMFATLILLAFNKIDFLETLPGMFTAIVSMIGSFMVIPKMITKYLFNKKEEEYLSNIISKIQEYDRNIRRGLR